MKLKLIQGGQMFEKNKSTSRRGFTAQEVAEQEKLLCEIFKILFETAKREHPELLEAANDDDFQL